MSAALALLSGTVVGFTLGLIGGGGSILATPLLLYVVGVVQPHMAIGTAALAVAVNAFANFAQHWRAGNVRWNCGSAFAAAGLLGTSVGSTLGKTFDGQKLLFLFAIVMVAVGLTMLRSGRRAGSTVRENRTASVETEKVTLKLVAVASAIGFTAGFFGIGGGFLIVPGLLFATGMPMINAIGTSLLAVGVFGLSTAVNYAMSGLVDWTIAAEYVGGGLVGGYLGMRSACSLASYRNVLNQIFAAVMFMVAGYMLYRTAGAWSSPPAALATASQAPSEAARHASR